MITTVLLAGELERPAVLLAESLTGYAPDEVVPLHRDPGRAAVAVSGSDVLVVASPVVQGRVEAELDRFLTTVDGGLSGIVAFALTTGDWPADAGAADLLRRSRLAPAGAVCPAPGLHLQLPPHGGTAGIARFAAFWRPALPALMAIARQHGTRALHPYEGKQT